MKKKIQKKIKKNKLIFYFILIIKKKIISIFKIFFLNIDMENYLLKKVINNKFLIQIIIFKKFLKYFYLK